MSQNIVHIFYWRKHIKALYARYALLEYILGILCVHGHVKLYVRPLLYALYVIREEKWYHMTEAINLDI